MLNALRLNEGFAMASFEERTGLKLDSLTEKIGRAQARGLMEQNSASWRATALGRRFLNDLQATFLP